MTTVYAPGVTIRGVNGYNAKVGDTDHPEAINVHTWGVHKVTENPFTKWARESMTKTKTADMADAFSKTELVPPPKAAEPRPGNTQREAVFRVVAAVEKALAGLPGTHGGVAGFLQAKGYRGDTSADRNALACWLADESRIFVYNTEPTLQPVLHKVHVWVESNGTIIESPAYQVALEPMPWQKWFIDRLRGGDFPALIRE